MGLGISEIIIIFGVCACALGPLLIAVIVYFVMRDRESAGE